MKNHRKSAFTLVEMLVVMALLAVLAAMVSAAVIRIRRFSRQIECQENLRQIGQTFTQIAMSQGGAFPKLYNKEASEDTTELIPWWTIVYRQWQGERDVLDTKPRMEGDVTTYGIQLPEQLPDSLKKIFHCPMASPLDDIATIASVDPDEISRDRLANLDKSISYGLNFDVKLYSGEAYRCKPDTDAAYPALQNPPAVTDDKLPDVYRIDEIAKPSSFILISEADTQSEDKTKWTGGRVACDATSTEPPPNGGYHPARIVGRHSGKANVLFADNHVEAMPVQTGDTWQNDINTNTPLWTLPED